MRRLAQLVACAAMLGCAGAGADTASADACADAPIVTYASFGRGFLTQECQGCHASTVTGDARQGAPDEVHFDAVDDVWIHADRILARASGEAPTMPPQAGTDADDRALLAWWLTCAEPGT